MHLRKENMRKSHICDMDSSYSIAPVKHNIYGRIPRDDRPLIILDFDGVINITRKTLSIYCDIQRTVKIPSPPENGRMNTMAFYPCDVTIRMCSPVLNELKSGIITGKYDVLWCTSWREYTQTIINPIIGFDKRYAPGYIDWKYRGLNDGGCYGKLQSIGECYRNGILTQPVIIIDDSFYPFLDNGGSNGWNRILYEYGINAPSHVIAPFNGITQGDFAEIDRFIEETC